MDTRFFLIPVRYGPEHQCPRLTRYVVAAPTPELAVHRIRAMLNDHREDPEGYTVGALTPLGAGLQADGYRLILPVSEYNIEATELPESCARPLGVPE